MTTTNRTDLERLLALPEPKTEPDARIFLAACVKALGGGFHPETRFADYARFDGASSTPTFNPAEALRLDLHMDAAYAALGGVDPCAVVLDMLHEQPTLPRYPDIEVRLVGQDGNVFNLIGMVKQAIRDAKGADAATEFATEAMQSADYDAVLRLLMRTVNVT